MIWRATSWNGASIGTVRIPEHSKLIRKVRPQMQSEIRGGAWDGFETDCRSARRGTEGVSPFIHDFILGFRVVLATS